MKPRLFRAPLTNMDRLIRRRCKARWPGSFLDRKRLDIEWGAADRRDADIMYLAQACRDQVLEDYAVLVRHGPLKVTFGWA